MRSFSTLLIALLLTFWVGVVAIVAVQNATPVTLQFLGLRSVQMPFGVVLAFCAMVGILGTALAQPALGLGGGSDEEE